MERLGDSIDGGVALINAPSTQFVRVNLILLKGLIDELGRSGVFISVDRPHQYMVHLMRMHGMAIEQVTFIDVISRFSADKKVGVAKVGFVDGPFNINSLPDTISMMSLQGGTPMDSISKGGFAMIDNIAALQVYNRNPTVELFINNFILMAKSSGNIFVPLVLDSEKSQTLFQYARGLADREVVVGKDFSVSENGAIAKATVEPQFPREVR